MIRMTQMKWMYDESDSQGPWVLLCDECCEAELVSRGRDYEKYVQVADISGRCACCGETDAYFDIGGAA